MIGVDVNHCPTGEDQCSVWVTRKGNIGSKYAAMQDME